VDGESPTLGRCSAEGEQVTVPLYRGCEADNKPPPPGEVKAKKKEAQKEGGS
jgi:hypothetical protein